MNWIMTTKEVFEEYGHPVPSHARQLSNGQYIQHFEVNNPLFVLMDGDSRKTLWTEEALRVFINWNEEEQDGIS